MFSSPLFLEHERVLLRPLALDDLPALGPIACDPAIWAFTPSRIYHPQELGTYLQAAMDARANGLRYPFAIVDKTRNVLAGSTSYANYSPKDQRIEVGYTWLGRNFQGTGLNKACKFLLFQYAFEQLGMLRVELKTDLLNQQSRKAMQKLGLVEEGVLRSHTAMHDGRRRDTIYYSLLAEEWAGVKQQVYRNGRF